MCLVQANRHTRTVLYRLLDDGLIDVRLTGDAGNALGQRNWYDFPAFKLRFSSRQWVMYLDVTAAVWFGRGFYRLINELYTGADRHIFKQEFDVVVTQTYAAVADT